MGSWKFLVAGTGNTNNQLSHESPKTKILVVLYMYKIDYSPVRKNTRLNSVTNTIEDHASLGHGKIPN